MPALENDRQERFALEYVVDLNATQAAIRAGYSPRSAKQTASRLLTNDDLQKRISELQAGVITRVDLSSDTILEEIRRVAESDIGDLVDDEGLLLPLKKMPAAARAAISSIEFKEDEDGVTTTKIKLWPKVPALALAAQHLELLTQRIEVSGEIELRVSKMTEAQRTERANELLNKVRALCGSAR